MNLPELQRLFFRAVRSDRPPPQLAQAFVGDDTLGVVRRMEIYRSAYWARHERCLQESYPILLERIGHAAFRRLVAGYIECHPSRRGAIEWAGESLPGYLAGHPVAGHDSALLADLARLEWARIVVRMAPDRTHAFDPASLRAPDVAMRAVRLSPAMRVLCVHARVRAWLATDGVDPDNAGPEPADSAQWVAVWRATAGVIEQDLAADEGRALERAARGEMFGAVCAEFEEPGALVRAGSAFRRWLACGWLMDLQRTGDA